MTYFTCIGLRSMNKYKWDNDVEYFGNYLSKYWDALQVLICTDLVLDVANRENMCIFLPETFVYVWTF